MCLGSHEIQSSEDLIARRCKAAFEPLLAMADEVSIVRLTPSNGLPRRLRKPYLRRLEGELPMDCKGAQDL